MPIFSKGSRMHLKRRKMHINIDNKKAIKNPAAYAAGKKEIFLIKFNF